MSNEVSCDSVARRVNGENPLDVLVGVSTPYGPLLTDDYGRSIRFCRVRRRTMPLRGYSRQESEAQTIGLLIASAYLMTRPLHRSKTMWPASWLRPAAASLVVTETMIAAWCCAVKESQNSLIFRPTPSRRWSGLTAMPSVSATSRAIACAASARPIPQKGLGVFHVWAERGATYQAVLGPCAYERRPEKTLTLPDELWSRNESWMRDFFEQETSDFLCLGVVSRRTYFGLVGGK